MKVPFKLFIGAYHKRTCDMRKGVVMKKKLTISQKRLLLCLVIVVIFVSAYQFIYVKYEGLSEDYATRTQELKQQMAQREGDLAQEDTLTQETQEINLSINTIIDEFPVRLTKVDNLIFIADMEQELGMEIPSVNFQDNISFYTTILPIRSTDGMDAVTGITAADAAALPDNGTDVTDDSTAEGAEGTGQYMTVLVSPISIDFLTTEEEFLKLVDYINTYPERTSLSDVSLSYDNSTGELRGSMMINRYILAGSGKTYELPDTGDISIGTDNLFGTKE